MSRLGQYTATKQPFRLTPASLGLFRRQTKLAEAADRTTLREVWITDIGTFYAPVIASIEPESETLKTHTLELVKFQQRFTVRQTFCVDIEGRYKVPIDSGIVEITPGETYGFVYQVPYFVRQ